MLYNSVYTLWRSVACWIWVFLHTVFLLHSDLTIFTGAAVAIPNLVTGNTWAALKDMSPKPCFYHSSAHPVLSPAKMHLLPHAFFTWQWRLNTCNCPFFRAVWALAMVVDHPVTYGLYCIFLGKSIPFCLQLGNRHWVSIPSPTLKMFSSALWVWASIYFLHGLLPAVECWYSTYRHIKMSCQNISSPWTAHHFIQRKCYLSLSCIFNQQLVSSEKFILWCWLSGYSELQMVTLERVNKDHSNAGWPAGRIKQQQPDDLWHMSQ